MKHQITAYFSVLYTSVSINHFFFLYERANGYSRHCMSGQKSEIVETTMKTRLVLKDLLKSPLLYVIV